MEQFPIGEIPDSHDSALASGKQFLSVWRYLKCEQEISGGIEGRAREFPLTNRSAECCRRHRR